MLSSHWPLADLRLQTPDLELRWPSPDDLGALAGLAAAGVHDPVGAERRPNPRDTCWPRSKTS